MELYRDALYIDPLTGNKLEMNHFAAACNAHYNQENDIFIFPIEMSGWGGDLQTLAADICVYSTSTTDKAEIENTIRSLFCGNSSFSEVDLLCDVDAINCSQILLDDNYLSGAFQQYYIGLEVNKRFSLFLDYYNGDLTDKMNELLPAQCFHDGTINIVDRKIHSATQLKFLKERLDELTSDKTIWPSSMQVQILKEFFQDYIIEQSTKEW